MRKILAVCAVLAASLAATGCDRATPPTAPSASGVVHTKNAKLTSFTFTKIPAAVANQAITSPVAGLDAIVFQMDATWASGLVVKQFGFTVSGSLQAGDVGNYQLYYFPDGLGKPPVLMATNDGSTWVAPGGFSFLNFDLATPITIPNGKTFTAIFALRADVNGTGTFFFVPSVQTCLINNGIVDQDVTWFGGDLPLRGDVFNVN